MHRQVGGAQTWSVAVHWVCRFWGFIGGVGQGQPQPATCAGLGVSEAEPDCDPKLAAASAGPTAT